jgi:pimeloyl-ACP methyl ester carboxylesterase
MSVVTPFERPGVTLVLHESGEAGLPFVFQHGLCGDANQTADVMPDIAGIRCMTLECRGHGGSQAGDPALLSIATLTDDVAALIASQNLAPAVVGGISMGAAIALRLAVHRPGDVRALVLARPAWVTRSAPDNMRPYGEVGALLARYPAPEARRIFAGSDTAKVLRRDAPDNLASLDGFFNRMPHDITRDLLTSIARDGPGIEAADLGRIACPVLILGHEQDLAHPFAMCEELAALLPRARLVKITPKARDKATYRSDFQAALTAFFKDIQHGAT